MIATGRAARCSARRIRRIASPCDAWVPCEKLRRKTSTPAPTSCAMRSSLSLAGPGSWNLQAIYVGDSQFGGSFSPVVTEAVSTPIPTLSEWTLIALVLALGGLALFTIRD